MSFLSLVGVSFALLLEAQPPARIGVFTFSFDSVAGFKDEHLDSFRRELGEHVEDVTEVAYSRESADVTVQYLGPGSLSLELGPEGDVARFIWTPEDEAPHLWAVVRIGAFGKWFRQDGSGGRAMSRLAESVGEWLRANAGAIRDRRLEARP